MIARLSGNDGCPTRRRLAMLRIAVAGAIDPTSKRLAERLYRAWWPVVAAERIVTERPTDRPLINPTIVKGYSYDNST
jgi:hypothetical protein